MPPVPKFDIAVIGAGTAGLSAAVVAASRGLSVCVCERESAPLAPPGETLHPGCGVIFEQLGITRTIDHAATARHLGISVTDDNGVRHEPYGEDARGQWRGYQLPRDSLHQILLARALDLGAEVQMETLVHNLDTDGVEQMRLDTSEGPVSCRWLLDGTGTWGWSARKDFTSYAEESPRLTARYGYEQISKSAPPVDWPSFQMTPMGWFWQANLGNGQVAWVDLHIGNDISAVFAGSSVKAADMTWRIARQPARGRVFRIGDAALRLDPAAGRGVLRATMSAIMAVHTLSAVDEGATDRSTAEKAYNEWIRQWFATDCEELTKLYGSRFLF